MPIIRKFAIQGHAVPSGIQRARGPFPAELYQSSPVVYENSHSDSLHEALDNVRMFRCKYCTEILYEDELFAHECVAEDEEEYEK
jgi:hypothetical protein